MIAFMIYGGLALTVLGAIFMYMEIKTDKELARQEKICLTTFPNPKECQEENRKVA